MYINNNKWLFRFMGLGLLVFFIIASVGNCHRKKVDKKPPNTEVKECGLPHNVPDCPPCATDDEDEVGAKSGPDDEADGEGVPDSTECAVADDCGCGYQCVDGHCRQFDFSCCTDENCKIGEFCNKNSYGQNGVCLPSECDGDDDCDRCGTRCMNHTCVLTNCCGDSDCQNGWVCPQYYWLQDSERTCQTPQCASNADCGCGEFCEEHFCIRIGYSTNRNPCCDDDFYYDGHCYPHEWIENEGCLGDEHCPAGKVCFDKDVCLPPTCANNADCGCEAVCRKGKCETGCDDSSGCCTEGHICDRGECIDPNEEEEENEE